MQLSLNANLQQTFWMKKSWIFGSSIIWKGNFFTKDLFAG